MSAALADWLRARLPSYAAVGIVLLDELPLTANGSSIAYGCPAPPSPHPRPCARAAASDPLGVAIAGVWSEVLGVAHVRRDDDFSRLAAIALGDPGNRARTGANSASRSVCARCSRHAAGRLRPPGASLRGAASDPPMRRRRSRSCLSFAEERLWFYEQLHPGTSVRGGGGHAARRDRSTWRRCAGLQRPRRAPRSCVRPMAATVDGRWARVAADTPT